MIWQAPYYRRITQLADGLATAASFAAAYFLWDTFRILSGISSPLQVSQKGWKIAGFSVVWILILGKLGAYSYRRFASLKNEIQIVARTAVIGVFFMLMVFFLMRFGYVPRSYIVIFAVTNFALLSLEKALFFRVTAAVRRKGKRKRNVVVVGTGDRAKSFLEIVDRYFSWDLNILGLTTGDTAKVGQEFFGHAVIGGNEEIEKILHRTPVDEVVICVSTKRFDQIREILEICEREGVQVRLNSDFFGKIAKKVRVDHIYGLPIISFITTPDEEWSLYVKRLMDIVISAMLLVMLSPAFLVIAVLIKLTSKGPILYEWNVVGLNKKPFRSWKFRTMVPEADKMKRALESQNIMKGPVFKLRDDPRITRVGKFLRKFSLDELPQLWSVLKGNMSLVGPRPAGPHELERYASWHRRKLSIKPGITCLWQVSGRNEISDFDDWVRLDLEYIDHWSLWLDIKILGRTALSVLRGSGL